MTTIYQVISPDQLQATLVVAIRIELDDTGPFADGAYEEVTSAQALQVLRGADEELALEIDNAGRIRYWVGPTNLNHAGRLVYRYRGPSDELIHVGGEEICVPPLSGTLSRWAVPYFLELEDILEDYRDRCAKFSQCPILSRAWRNDGRRLIFAPGPEHHMRDSLVYTLRLFLREHKDVEVMPEQNVNATRPVDIKVRWNDGRQIAMIEIKWLGKSAAVGAAGWGSQHSAKRGLDGLQQLADYLDLFRGESPHLDARGYLVVFDGRRNKLKVSGEAISRADAFKFEHDALPFQPDLLARPDMASPKRFFLEPAAEGIAS
ncbi:MAG TPA: hypothetical protein VFT70_12065 [Nocardioides sp.]|nr:hypothetical protein [Nocardioides sp.]